MDTGSGLGPAELQSLFEHCSEAVVVVDAAGLVTAANPAANRLIASPGGDLRGSRLGDVVVAGEMDALLRSMRLGRTVGPREVQVGPGRTAAVSAVRVEGGPGAEPRYLILASDVTELRRLEAVRRDFVANVSHELRTPLASIRAMAETLREGAAGDADVADHFLTTIIAEAERLARISEDLLILSQAESRQIEMGLVHFGPVLAGVVSRFQPQAERSGLALSAEIGPNLTLNGNADQLEQVVVNLVDNAIKYTPSGGRVQITAQKRGGRILLTVRDTGIGIRDEDLARLFERFYRVDKARSRASGGTGLGLSIVKHIVEAHRGTVTVQSEFNAGTEFTVNLPAR